MGSDARSAMAQTPKEKLFRRLIRSANPLFLLERMRANGFWPYGVPLPPDPPEEIAERRALEKEVAELSAERATIVDPDAALCAERKRRWEESKKRRAEAKASRESARAERRAAWEKERAGALVHAGRGVSAGLAGRSCDEARLASRGLPPLRDAVELACALGIPLSRLRWLTFHRASATLVHYHRFEIPKKGGGMRAISAPKPALAIAQQWVRSAILERLEVEPEAHGFVRDRSILTNAAPHVGQPVVVNMDVRDFFPSITFRRVKGLFGRLGYGEQVATLLALLCTEPPRAAARVDGRLFHVAIGERCLPQGACTSPAITNALCRRLDRRLRALAARHGYAYTRYADDLTFSGPRDGVGRLLQHVRFVLGDEGFTEHERKTRVMGRGRRQEVTGLTVNTRPGVARGAVRELRAILTNAARHGLQSQNRDSHPHFAAYLRGRIEYVSMADPTKRAPLLAALDRALDR